MRFPRVTRIRNDKDWETATNLDELKHLYKTSKEKTDVSLLNNLAATASGADESPVKKNKGSPSKGSKIDSYFTKKDATNRQSETSSLNTSTSSDKSKNEANFDTSDEMEEKSSKRDKNRTIKKEKSSDDSRNNEVTDKAEKKNKKRKFKEDSSDDRISDDVAEIPRKKDKKMNLKEKLNRRNSENKTDDEQIVSDEGLKNKKRAEHNKDKKRKIKEELNTSNSSENKTVYEIPRKKIKAKKRTRDSRGSTPEIKEDHETSTSKEFDFESGPKSPLPDVFKDKRLGFYPDFISIPEEERIDYERHWIAYGGNVVKSVRAMDVDYVVHNDRTIGFEEMQRLKKKVPDHTRHVHKYWLDECINECTLCDTTKYAVIVEP